MSSHPSALLKAPSLLAVLLVQVSVLWQRLYEVGRAAALPLRLRLLEAANVARLAAIATLQDPNWLGVAAPPRGETPQPGNTSESASADPWLNEPAGAVGWWEHLPTTPKNHYSKNGEDGILLYIVRNVQHTMKQYVDLGADGGRGTSTMVFRRSGWRGVMFSSERLNTGIGLYKEQFFPNNVVAKFGQYKIARNVDLMVVDLDANDAHVVRALWKAGYKPRIMMMETNDNFGEESVLSFPPGHAFLTHQWTSCGQVCSYTMPDGTTNRAICGASVRGLMRMGDEFGYVSLYLNKHNLFLVRGDLLTSRVRELWTHDHVFNLSRAYGRRKLPFPRKECDPFMKGLVPLVQDVKKQAGTTIAPAKPKPGTPPAAAAAAAKAATAAAAAAAAAARGQPPAKPAAAPRPAGRPGKPLVIGSTTEPPPPFWWTRVPSMSHLRRVYYGIEEGILEYLFMHVAIQNRRYVEFPAGDGSATLSRWLREENNWTGTLFDCCHSDPTVNLHQEDISTENVLNVFAKHKITREFDLLAVGQLDDSAFVLRSLFQGGYRPRFITIAVNPNFGDESRLSFPDKRATKRRRSACGPVCTFQSAQGEKTVMCGVAVSGLLSLLKEATYWFVYLTNNTLVAAREGLLEMTFAYSWGWSALLKHSRERLGREVIAFPRKECDSFVDGLVEVPALSSKPPERANRWWERLPARPRKIHSQNDEDGIIMHIFQNVKPKNKQYFEFGSENGSETNTRALRSLGWTGTNLDQGFEDPSINLYKEFVAPDNIVDLLEKYKVPTDVDILSVDVDSFDLHILRSILLGGYRPRLLIVETNDNFGEESTLTYPGHTVRFWDWSPACGQVCAYLGDDGTVQTSICGVSVRGLVVLGASAGYRPLYLNKVNLFLIRGDTLPSDAAQNWTFQAVLDRSVGLERAKKEFPKEACQKYMDGLIEVEPLPPSNEAIPLETIMPVVPSKDSGKVERTETLVDSEPAATEKAPTAGTASADAEEELEEDSVTAWLKAAAKAAKEAGAAKTPSKDAEEKAVSKAAQEATTVSQGDTPSKDGETEAGEAARSDSTAVNETLVQGSSSEASEAAPSDATAANETPAQGSSSETSEASPSNATAVNETPSQGSSSEASEASEVAPSNSTAVNETPAQGSSGEASEVADAAGSDSSPADVATEAGSTEACAERSDDSPSPHTDDQGAAEAGVTEAADASGSDSSPADVATEAGSTEAAAGRSDDSPSPHTDDQGAAEAGVTEAVDEGSRSELPSSDDVIPVGSDEASTERASSESPATEIASEASSTEATDMLNQPTQETGAAAAAETSHLEASDVLAQPAQETDAVAAAETSHLEATDKLAQPAQETDEAVASATSHLEVNTSSTSDVAASREAAESPGSDSEVGARLKDVPAKPSAISTSSTTESPPAPEPVKKKKKKKGRKK